jgi:hypothetical protein
VNVWCDARIIDVNASARLLKVHYIGWHKRYDAWVGLSSIASHGSNVPNIAPSGKSLTDINSKSSLLLPVKPKHIETSAKKQVSSSTAKGNRGEKFKDKDKMTGCGVPAVVKPGGFQKNPKRDAARSAGSPPRRQKIQIKAEAKLLKRKLITTESDAVEAEAHDFADKLKLVKRKRQVKSIVNHRAGDIDQNFNEETRSALANFFRNRMTQQDFSLHLMNHSNKDPSMADMNDRNQMRQAHLLQMQAQSAFLHDSINTWKAQMAADDKGLIHDVKKVVCL